MDPRAGTLKNLQLQSDELRDRCALVKAAYATRNRLISSMSHELLTPLNAIIGFSELLYEQIFGNLNQRQQEYAREISEAGEALLTLINDLVEIAQIETGNIELNLSPANIDELLHACIVMVREKACKHQIAFHVHVEESLARRMVLVDGFKCKQIMFNLLSNAIRFTPCRGRVTINACIHEQQVVIRVSDSGLGMKPEFLHRMYVSFESVDPMLPGQEERTGLQLAWPRNSSNCTEEAWGLTAKEKGKAQPLPGASLSLRLRQKGRKCGPARSLRPLRGVHTAALPARCEQ